MTLGQMTPGRPATGRSGSLVGNAAGWSKAPDHVTDFRSLGAGKTLTFCVDHDLLVGRQMTKRNQLAPMGADRLNAIDRLRDAQKLLALVDRAICDVPEEIALGRDERDGVYLVCDMIRARIDHVIDFLEGK